MSYENLKIRALTVRDSLIKCQSMAMFASIRDIKSKSVHHLKKLRAMGINGLSIGMESGDDETLKLANKNYTAADTVEQLAKLDEAGIEYYLVYMTGLAGKGNGRRNARSTAETLNQIRPYFGVQFIFWGKVLTDKYKLDIMTSKKGGIIMIKNKEEILEEKTEKLHGFIREYLEMMDKLSGTNDFTLDNIERSWGELEGNTKQILREINEDMIKRVDEKGIIRSKKKNTRQGGSL